jgi:N-sulfoglucosamine sulfohydrolase
MFAIRPTLLFLLGLAFLAPAKPNFLIVLADDVGWDAFGCTGMEIAKTPAIDKLAAESCMMDRFYCCVSQCAPLRAELYTGLLPNRNGVLANAKQEARPDVRNVADHLKPLGYAVGLTGKRHFSRGKAKIDTIGGFNPNGNGSNQTHSFDGLRSYIEAAQAADQAFCIFICSTHAHHPWDHGNAANYPLADISLRPHYIDTPAARQSVARHAAEVEVLDQQVHEARTLLDEMKLADDTVFIFLSEQGIAMPRGKWSPYDHGSRALCLAHWPGKIQPRRSHALAMYCDILPTLIDLAGGDEPGLDGRSLKALWTDTGVAGHRDSVLISNVHPFWQKAIVTDRYKLIWSAHPNRRHIWNNFTSESKFFSRPWAEWLAAAETDPSAARKLQRILHPAELELYDLHADPYETNDLARSPEQAPRVQRLHASLKLLMTANNVPLAAEPEPEPETPKKKRRTKRKSK